MYIGIDIGGTHIRVAKGENGKFSETSDFPTKTFEENRKDIFEAVKKISSSDVKAIGVGAPGPITHKESKIIDPNKFSGWTNINIEEELKKDLQVPVFVGHDATLASLAEFSYGAQKGKDPFLYITVSTGIGIGIIHDGKPLHGLYHPHAGHQFVSEGGIKCWCGQDSDLESTVSGWALKKMTGKHPSDIEGSDLWDKTMDTLSKGVANLIMSYSPEVVVIGGGMTRHKDIFFTPVIAGVKKYLKIFPTPPIHPTSLDEPGLVGAIEFAQNRDQNG